MRKSPVNHLVSAFVVLLGWAVGVIWGAVYLGDGVSFQRVTPQDFQWIYRVVLSALAVQAIGVLAWWISFGSRDRAAMELGRARRLWTTAWLFELVLSLAAVLFLALFYLGELFEPLHYVAMFATTTLVTWGGFWIATLLCSPRGVEYIPIGKR